MITATTMSYGSPVGNGRSEHASFTIHNGPKMISVSVDNSGGRMSHMARADIRCLFSNNTAGIEDREPVEDVTGKVFKVGVHDVVQGNVSNMAKAMNWLQMARWGLEGQTL
jgi:siroheme synthase (precorrin-2 oxidase/ferrochelatase)